MPEKLTEEEFEKRMSLREGLICLDKFPGQSRLPVIAKCTKCGYEWKTTPLNLVGFPENKRVNCPKCANEARRKYLNYPIRNYLKTILDGRDDGDEYEWKDTYNLDNKKKLHIVHKVCGKEFLVRSNDFQQGYGCPFCIKYNAEYKHSKVYLKMLYSNLTNEKFLKVGIDSNSRRHFENYDFENVYLSKFISRIEASELEKKILNEYKQFRYKPILEFTGKTECFVYTEELINKIKEFILSNE